MSTPNSETQQQRRRLADQIANQLFTARLMGGRVRLIQTHRAYLSTRPQLHDILTAAPPRSPPAATPNSCGSPTPPAAEPRR